MQSIQFKPGKVKGYDDLETLAERQYDEVESYLGPFFTKNGPIRGQREYDAAQPLFAPQATLLAPLVNYDHSLEMQTLSRRAYYAGALIGQKLSPAKGWENGLEVYKDMPAGLARQHILETTADYMGSRLYLGKLVNFTADKIDSRWKYRAALTTITSLVCMYVELQRYEQFIGDEATRFATELENL